MTDRKNFYNKKLQNIGWLKRDKKFRKVVSKKTHLFKLMDAWGIESYVIKDLIEQHDCEQIRIKETDENVIYIISIKDWVEHAVERDLESPQQFVSRKFFKKLDATTWKSLESESSDSSHSSSPSTPSSRTPRKTKVKEAQHRSGQ